MPSAKDSVFSTPELCQLILLQLPSRDLLVNAQRINRHFHTTITSSPIIQEVLFFQPRHPDSGLAPQPNPLLAAAFPPWFQDRRLFRIRFSLPDAKSFETLDWASSPEKAVAYARRDASWRRMLVVQPPATTLDIIKHVDDQNGALETKSSTNFKKGATMGVLYDLVEDFIVVRPPTSFVIQWHMLPFADPGGDEVITVPDVSEGGRITLVLGQTLQCVRLQPIKLDPKFKSRAFKRRPVKFGPGSRQELFLTW